MHTQLTFIQQVENPEYLCWMLSGVGRSCTAWQDHRTCAFTSPLVLHLPIMHSLCEGAGLHPLLPLPVCLSMRLDQEAQHTCHIHNLYLGVFERLCKSLKGCKADASEAHVHDCAAQVWCTGVQVEEGCEAGEDQGLADLQGMSHCWLRTYLHAGLCQQHARPHGMA